MGSPRRADPADSRMTWSRNGPNPARCPRTSRPRWAAHSTHSPEPLPPSPPPHPRTGPPAQPRPWASSRAAEKSRSEGNLDVEAEIGNGGKIRETEQPAAVERRGEVARKVEEKPHARPCHQGPAANRIVAPERGWLRGDGQTKAITRPNITGKVELEVAWPEQQLRSRQDRVGAACGVAERACPPTRSAK